MTRVRLTLKGIRARPVVVPLKRPVVSKVGLFRDWPLILIDLYTHEGVVGHSYLEPYLKQSVRYILPALEDLAQAAKDQPIEQPTRLALAINLRTAKALGLTLPHSLLLRAERLIE